MSATVTIDDLKTLLADVDAHLDDIGAARSTPVGAIAAIVLARGHISRVAYMLRVAAEQMPAAPAAAGMLQ